VTPFFSHSSKGPRPVNQDSWLVTEIPKLGTLYCVADGVGGNLGGEIASKLAVETITSCLQDNLCSLDKAMEIAHKAIVEKAETSSDLKGMASTLTAILVSSNKLQGVSAGDSRAYILRGNGLKQLSLDHSEVVRLQAQGKISKEDALIYPRKHVIYSALGSHKPLVIDKFDFELIAGDRVVLLTDGFSNSINKSKFRDLSITSPDISSFGNSLVKCINEVGSSDNYTVVAFQSE
jgi:serine/threonine protein phosphatase PrpC